MSDFRRQNYKGNSTGNQDPAHSMHTNVCIQTYAYTLRITIERTTPKIVKKNQEKTFVTDVLKNPKTSLERLRVTHNAFSCYDTISRGRVRRILKKYGLFSRNAAKELV